MCQPHDSDLLPFPEETKGVQPQTRLEVDISPSEFDRLLVIEFFTADQAGYVHATGHQVLRKTREGNVFLITLSNRPAASAGILTSS